METSGVEIESSRLGVDVIDSVENRRLTLKTDEGPSLKATGTDWSTYPLDTAAKIQTGKLSIGEVHPIIVRTEEGDMVDQVDQKSQREYTDGPFLLEICGPIKMYLKVPGDVKIESGTGSVAIKGDGISDPMVLGARSLHEQPAGSVTVPKTISGVARGISHLGSAIKSLSPERSFPTLRGHPPLIETDASFMDGKLERDEHIEPPDVDITIAPPNEWSELYATAPLAYYFGADVNPVEGEPHLQVGDWSYDLPEGSAFEESLSRILQKCFTLDCVVRTEGYYDLPLEARRALEPELPFDLTTIYNISLEERTREYLHVDYDVVEPFIPEWKLVTTVQPKARYAEQLPYLVDDLALIQSPRMNVVSNPTGKTQKQVEAFARDGEMTRSATRNATETQDYQQIKLNSTVGLEHAWLGEGAPIGASKVTEAGFKNRLEKDGPAENITITAICNEPEMVNEADNIEDIYGNDAEYGFDLQTYSELDTETLRLLLTGRDHDLLHYVGHIDHNGIKCPDGYLDIGSLGDISVDSFLLNACTSFDQGMKLVERGAIGGIVTLQEVINSGAERMGKMLARLLNAGYPLQAGLEIARDISIMGGHYIVVGDGNLSLTQFGSGVPYLVEIDNYNPKEGLLDISIMTYPTYGKGLGSLFISYVTDETDYHLTGGTVNSYTVSEERLGAFLKREAVPVKYQGGLFWSDTSDLEDGLGRSREMVAAD